MHLSERQKNRFLVLIGHAFCEIRGLCRESGTKIDRAKALRLADGFHNIPSLLGEKYINSD